MFACQFTIYLRNTACKQRLAVADPYGYLYVQLKTDCDPATSLTTNLVAAELQLVFV